MIYTVEAIEDGMVKLEKSDGSFVLVPSESLTCNVNEGDILHFDGYDYSVDKAATDVRRNEIYDKYKRLFKK